MDAKMMRQLRVSGAMMLITLLQVSCSEPEAEPEPDTSRWYRESQVTAGAQVFTLNCAQCHGERAQGLVSDWRQRLDDGSLPAPPLDGSAHAWHHPQSVLLQVINSGGADFGGNMPSFATELDETEKLAVIAYFQSFWSDEIYDQWIQMGGVN